MSFCLFFFVQFDSDDDDASGDENKLGKAAAGL